LKLTAQLKLQPSAEQATLLRRTLEVANAASNYISECAWSAKTFRQFDLHKLCYRTARERFGLAAQVAVRCISKVADAYKLDHKTKRTFRADSAIAYDTRILRFEAAAVSIWAIGGRISVPFVCGEPQQRLLATQRGESDLIYRRGSFYLNATCEATEARLCVRKKFLGVDLGIVNIASDSDGRRYSGSEVKSVRYRQRRLRAKLQKKQTRAAKRRLKKLSGKEARFARHTNHVISKEIVACAEGTKRGIKLEDLWGIRDRVDTVCRRKQRVVLHSWAFFQLRSFIAYKAALAGVPVVYIDPKNTSRECSKCGHIDKKNRPNQSTFRCLACRHAGHADTNAARVISGRAARKPAVLSELCAVSHGSVKSRRL
jgi:putative transposase